MINIKDKLKRTNINIKRTAGSVDYVSLEKFEDDVQDIREEIEGLNIDLSDYTTIDDFNRSMAQIDTKIDDILEAIENTDGRDYNEGYSDGLIAGDTRGYKRGIADQKAKLESITIVRNGTYTNDDGYNNILVDVPNVSGDGTGFDYTAIGYSADDSNSINRKQNEDIAYSKSYYDNWNPNDSENLKKFYRDDKLVYAPLVDTSKLTSAGYLFYECYSLRFVPQLDLTNAENMRFLFYKCQNLETVLLDLSKGKDMYSMFSGCSNLKNVNFDCSSAEDMNSMFSGCSRLETADINAASCQNMEAMFSGCSSLQNVVLRNTDNVTDMTDLFRNCIALQESPTMLTDNLKLAINMFSYCEALRSIPRLFFGNVTSIRDIFYGTNNITNLGGFQDLKIDWNDSNGLSKCSQLTHQSIMNVINNLYDFRATGDTTTIKTLKIHRNTMDLLSDADIRIATDKGWVITA